VRAAGFDGIEASLDDIGASLVDRKALVSAAQAEGVTLVLSAYSSWTSYVGPFDAKASVREHAANLSRDFRQIADLATTLPRGRSPVLKVNAHSGSDAWSENQAHEFFDAAMTEQAAIGSALPPVSHETHRGRYLCCPFATARMLTLVPALRLTSDFSHWVVKCERLLDTPEERALLESVIAPAVDHIHARIGTPQSPQVLDVTHNSARRAADRHYEWWEQVWASHEATSLSRVITATVEYGPTEVAEDGEYVGYTPTNLDLKPVAGVEFSTTLEGARHALERRFESWHGKGCRMR
jgi:sugar phosphate isomerase/epimerase